MEQGHKKIAFIGGTKKYKTSIDREEGYHAALRDHDIRIDPTLEKVGYFSINRGYQAMCELIDERPDITAVFAANDLMAIGSYKAIKERNLKIPDDIAVVGFDATEYAEALNPPLTTVKKNEDGIWGKRLQKS